MENAHGAQDGYVCIEGLADLRRVLPALEVYREKRQYNEHDKGLFGGKHSAGFNGGLKRGFKRGFRASLKESFRRSFSLFKWAGKKAVFITSVPFYWLIIFRHVLHWYDAGFFAFVVIASLLLSMLGGSWGIMQGLAR
ncbi:MAG: hypothetical protein R6U32_03790 [Candidatus Woesearchaeota archaeon]